MVNLDFEVPEAPKAPAKKVMKRMRKKQKSDVSNYCHDCGVNVSDIWQENPVFEEGRNVYVCNDCKAERLNPEASDVEIEIPVLPGDVDLEDAGETEAERNEGDSGAGKLAPGDVPEQESEAED